MKKSFFISTVLLITITSNATTYVVNNIPNSYADFTTLQDAVDGANNGDVLLIQPSPDSYGNATINKQLHIVGRGYFLEPNPEISGSTFTCKVDGLTFSNGSGESILEGMETGNITINTNNITIGRNKTGNINIVGPTNANEAPIGNIFIENNYSGSLIVRYKVDFVVANNNLFYDTTNTGTDHYNIYISNNIINRNMNAYNFTYSNNIQLYTNGFTINGNTNSAYNNNISAGFAPNVASNIGNVDLSTVFIDYPNNNDYETNLDTRFQLINNSTNPAKGAGENGEDCGMFGGSTPYVASGIPSRPSVYAIYAPAKVENGNSINVHIKAKSN